MSEAIALLTPDAIQAVIDKEAKDLTDQDVENLIAHYRKERENFQIAEAQGRKPTARKAKATAAADPELDKLIADLDV